MNFFLTVSRTGMKKHIEDYKKVLSELERQNVKVTTTILKQYADRLKAYRKSAKTAKEKKYANDTAVRKAIAKSDAVIIEASYPSFRLGFEAYYALSLEKPVLVLSKLEDYSSLIDQPNFFGARYTDFTLPDELEKFLIHVKEYKLRIRFNLFISELHKKKLEKASKHFNVSMSDYLRKLIEEDVV
jgi:hypothetical protein